MAISREFFDRARDAADEDGRLKPGPMTRWDVFPYESVTVAPLTELELPEPRGDTSPEECRICRRRDDTAHELWSSENFVVAGPASTSLMFWGTVSLRTHRTLDMLDGDELAEMGQVLGRTFRAVSALDGVGRVHINKWENNTGHLLWNVLARPEGVLQLRGSNLPAWADMLPPIPEDELAQRAARVAELLAQS